jgi:hypothetical protein
MMAHSGKSTWNSYWVWFFLIGIWGLTIACSPTTRLTPLVRVPADRGVEEDKIRESIIRYQIAHWYTNVEAEVFFVSVEDADPSPEFLQHFSGMPRRVEGESVADKPKGSQRWVLEKSTRKHGVLLFLNAIQWHSTDLVKVEGGFYCGVTCAASGEYQVQRKNEHWTVTNFEVHVIS